MTERTQRTSARTVIVDDEGRVLLFRIVDPLDDKGPVWITPGGGVEHGEDLRAAAARELAEETGLVVRPAELGAPVAVCRGDWVFRGTPLYSEDWYFSVRAPNFIPDDAGWTDIERELHVQWRWWTCDELDSPHEPILPAQIADVARAITRGDVFPEPVELIWTDA